MEHFHKFGEAVRRQFERMSQSPLFITEPLDLFDSYLKAFPEGSNPIFRERTEHDCNCCKNFVRNLGRVVAIRDGHVMTVWDSWQDLPEPYATVGMHMQRIIRQLPITGVYITKQASYGAGRTPDSHDDHLSWDHFFGKVPPRAYSATPERDAGHRNTTAQVFKRGLEELTAGAFDQVLDLIKEGNLYRADQYKAGLEAFYAEKKKYDALDIAERSVFVWSNLDSPSARLRNTAIGTLLIDLSGGMDIESAVRRYEAVTAPANYKRPKPLITKRMVDDAMKTIQSLNLEPALDRRFARLSDVGVNDILFVSNKAQKHMKGGVANLLMEEVKPTSLSSVKATEQMKAEDFFQNIAPKCTSMELLLDNKHLPNFMSLTAPVDDTVEPIFQWGNNFGWSYDGEVTDSIKEKVKRAGGNISAHLRVSLAWFNHDDLDIHCIDARGKHIYYSNKAAVLDVDMNAGSGTTRTPVENLAWSRTALIDGTYRISVHNFSKRENRDIGFVLEIENDGKIEQYNYSHGVAHGETIDCFALNVVNGSIRTIKMLNSRVIGGSATTDKWGLSTNNFIPVETVMLSPNYWGDRANGNKHWFFMLEGCKNPLPVRGIYNEFLRQELSQHRKVFEVLGSKTMCQPTDEQLSGLGFSASRKDTAIIAVKGKDLNRTIEIVF